MNTGALVGGGSVTLVLVLLLLLGNLGVDAQTPPSNSQEGCLYFTTNDGKLSIASWSTDPSPVFNSSDPGSITLGNIFHTIPDVGVLPTGIEIHNKLIYIASYMFINTFSYDEFLTQTSTPFFTVFNNGFFTGFCNPNYIVALNDVMYVTCTRPVPYSIIKLSLADEDYGKVHL